MAKTEKKNLFFSFGGVALADILANGVVVLLVVIILTLSIRKQQTEQEIEQSAEISAILARDIASSLVFNDLPSSPPAVLHNYNCVNPRGPWRNEYERHDCMPWLYPIIELHDTYIRELNSNRIFTKELLLEENNEFDAYLRSLPQIARERIRADIYELDLYYLAISIMKENGARPNHWHFLGEYAQPPEGVDYLSQEDHQHSDDEISSEDNSSSWSSGEGDEFSGEEQAEQQEGAEGQAQSQESLQDAPQVPDDVSLRDAQRIDELLPPDARLGRGGEQRLQNSDARAQLEQEFDGEGSFGDELAEALAEALLEERGGTGDEFGRPSSVSVRFPGAGSQEGREGEEQSAERLFEVPFSTIQESLSANGEQIDYHTFMLILMMEYLKASNALGFDRITLQDVLAQLISGQIDITTHPLLPFVLELRDEMQLAFNDLEPPMGIRQSECENCLSKLWLNANLPLRELLLQSMQVRSFRQESDIINMRMRLYSYPDQGDETELLRGDSVLIHPDVIQEQGRGWYAAAIVDPNLSDIVVGYIYGETDGDDFYVLGDVNSVRIDQRPVLSVLPFFPLRREVILGVLYGLLSFGILAVFFYLVVSGLRHRRAA